ncbi:prenyltransferase [Candidatus Saccharibacteria bacterium]|nr:prenyltransferase [Candidatus Saccharibacteria bacterium]
MIDSLVKLFKVSRPISWVNTAYPFAATYLLLGGGVDALFIIGTVFFLIPYNLLMYGVNDVFDYESDILNPRKNSIEGALEAKEFHPTILLSAILATLPFAMAIIILSDLPAALIFIVVLFFVVAYSLKGLRFKEIPFLDSITSSIHFVGPMIFAMAITGFQSEAWPFALALFLWGIASHAFGAVQDVIPDREGKLKSIATIIGARATVWLSAVLYLAAVAAVGSQGGLSLIVAAAGLIYVGNVVPYLKITDKTSATANKSWRRFIWLNYIVGAVVTIVCIINLL